MVPICGFCIVQLGPLAKPEERQQWCTALVVLRNSLVVLFYNTCVAGVLFRFLIIRYADRGLVVKGNTNLVLFNQLYWTFFGAFCCLGLAEPFVEIFQGTFGSLNKICVLLPFDNEDKTNDRSVFLYISNHSVVLFFTQWMTYRINHYHKMSCIGKFKRNILSYDKNRICLYLLFSTSIMIPFFVNLAKTYPTFVFWFQNFAFFSLIIIINILVVPASIPAWRVSQCKVKTFYVRKPVPEPRRSCSEGQSNSDPSTLSQPQPSCSLLLRPSKPGSMPVIDT